MSIFNFRFGKNQSEKENTNAAPEAVSPQEESKNMENMTSENCETNKKSENAVENEKAEKPADNDQQAETPIARRIYNLLILDESGSMSAIYQPAITGVNETLQTIREAQKENPSQEHFVTLVAFDSGHYNEIYHNIPAFSAVDITTDQYQPCGMTPLYDTMGRAINELRETIKDDSDVALVTVITDGYENASREYTGPAIKALIEELKKKNWVFTYIGANQDVEAVAASMAINNHHAFQADVDGTREMFLKERNSRKAFFSRVSQNQCREISDDAKADYFKD